MGARDELRDAGGAARLEHEHGLARESFWNPTLDGSAAQPLILEKAEPVNVLGESVVSGVDAALAVGGRITGTVTDEATAEPVGGATVCAFVIGTDIISCDATNAAGEYAVIGLPTSSTYKVEFDGGGEYALEYYNNKFSAIKATSVAVVAGATTSGINAALAP